MISNHSHRKDEHVSLAEKFFTRDANAGFDQVRLVHRSLAGGNFNTVDPSTSLFGGQLKLAWPFYIEAMTGGSERTGKLNQQLATIANATGIAIASGSESVALKDAQTAASFETIRTHAPQGVVFANLGANHPLKDVERAVQLVHADAVELHVNVAQEMIMPEGDREFDWLANIQNVVANASVPVIVKEVGFGMDRESIEKLAKVGVKAINISGRGGTNFAKIENFRRPNKDLAYLDDWGQTTVESLLEAAPYQDQMTIFASGGVRNPLDIIKAIVLGADAVGVAGAILDSLIHDGPDATTQMIQDWQNGIKTIMTMLGCATIDELKQQQPLLSTNLLNYTVQRF